MQKNIECTAYFVHQREHSNIISNLRATNEPLLCVTEFMSPAVVEPTEEAESSGDTAARQRKKVERNPSAPLPGMLAVSRAQPERTAPRQTGC